MTGVVQDPSGAVRPGAKVTVANESTGIRYQAETQANGVYYVPQLPPAHYSVAVSATGFKQVKISGPKVDAGAILTQDVVLPVGELSQSVVVEGQALIVDTTSGHVGTTIEMGQVADLPLPDRNVFNLVNLVPSAIYKLGPSDNPIGTSINGGNGVSVGGDRACRPWRAFRPSIRSRNSGWR